MSDLTTWTPSVSTYQVPGGSTVANTIAAGGPTAVKAGAIGVPYPTAPTLAQVQNSFTDFNQVAAMCNYRFAQWSILGQPYIPIQYLAPGSKVKALDILALQGKVDTVRSGEGFSQYAWKSPPVTGDKVRGYHLEDMRRALAVVGVASFQFPQNLINRVGLGAQIQECSTANFGGGFTFGGIVGGIVQGLGIVGVTTANRKRNRTVLDVGIPTYVNLVPQPHLNFLVTPRNSIAGVFNLQLYLSNTNDVSAPASRALNTNLLIAQIASSSLAIGVTSSLSAGSGQFQYQARGGSYYSMVLATDQDVGGNNALNSMDANPVAPNDLTLQVTWF